MSENTNATNQAENHQENNQELTVQYILEQINKIRDDTAHIFEALRQLETVKSAGPGDIGAEEKAKGIATVVKCRETTNQQLLSLYEKMYDDIKPANNRKLDVLAKLTDIAANADDFASEKSEMLDTIRQICRENFKD